MKVALEEVAKGPRQAALPLTSVSFRSGSAVLARAQTQQRPTVLGLLASGRMRPDIGTITIDGATDYSAMRRRIALIDAPDACEPDADVAVSGVVAEELMFAGKPSHLLAVRAFLTNLGLTRYIRWAIDTVPPGARIRILTELALLRRRVEAVVITSPDRHGGDPNEWWAIALDIANRGFAVLVIAGDAFATAIGATTLVERLGDTTWARETNAETFDEDPGRDDTDELPFTMNGTAVLPTASDHDDESTNA